MWVPPFRHPRLFGYLLLPAAFRSLSRLSSAPSAKASAPCSYSLNLAPCIALHGFLFAFFGFFLAFLVLVCLIALNILLVCLLSLYSVFKEHFLFLIRRPPVLPCRPQHSTFGRLRLNRRVRYGYGTFVPRVFPAGVSPPDSLTCPSADKQ